MIEIKESVTVEVRNLFTKKATNKNIWVIKGHNSNTVKFLFHAYNQIKKICSFRGVGNFTNLGSSTQSKYTVHLATNYYKIPHFFAPDWKNLLFFENDQRNLHFFRAWLMKFAIFLLSINGIRDYSVPNRRNFHFLRLMNGIWHFFSQLSNETHGYSIDD